MLLLMRPILRQDVVDQDMLLLCTEKAAEACEVRFVRSSLHGAVAERFQDCKTVNPESPDTSGSGRAVPVLLQRCDLAGMPDFADNDLIAKESCTGNCSLLKRSGSLLTLLPGRSSVRRAL